VVTNRLNFPEAALFLPNGSDVTRDARHELGKLGEDLACAELSRRGYVILARRYRTRYGEIDIVARDGPTIVIVEVKTREGTAFGMGVEAVTALKQRRLQRMGTDYLLRRKLADTPCRFDVVDVNIEGGVPRIQVYRDAFDVGAA
jgi:putative endonuclease